MIDPLMTAALPPPREKPREPQTGAPAFLPWANASSGQGGVDHRDAGLQDPVTPEIAIEDLPGALLGTAASDAARAATAATDATADAAARQAVAATSPVLSADAGTLEALQVDGLPLDALQLDERLLAQADVTLELHLARPGGEREIVALPWRLFAQHRLAYITGGDATVVGAASAHAAGTHASIGGGSIGGGMTAVGLPMDADPSLVASQAALPLAMQSTTASTAGGGVGASAGARAQATPAAMEWLARWMKWIERDGRDPVVWLRDFRLDADGIREVVEGLRTLAREQGTPLSRIVVNGREQWRAPSFQTTADIADTVRPDHRREV